MTDPILSITKRLTGKLAELGMIPAATLDALIDNQTSNSSILNSIRRTRRVTDGQIAQAFEAIGIAPANLNHIDPEAVSIIDGDHFEAFFERYKAMPYLRDEGQVTVVMDDPTNEEALRELKRLIEGHLVITYARKEAQDVALQNAIMLYELSDAFEQSRAHFPSVSDEQYQAALAHAQPGDTVAHALVRVQAQTDAEAFAGLASSYGLPYHGFLPNRFSAETLPEQDARALNTVVLTIDERHAQVITDHPEKQMQVEERLGVPVHTSVTTPAIMEATFDEAYAASRKVTPPGSLTQALIRMKKLPDSEASNDKAPDEALKAGRITEEDMGRALALYRNIEFINPDERPSNPAALGMVPEHILKENRAWPHSVLDSGELLILISDPRHKPTINAITRNVKTPVVFAVATPTAITRLLHSKVVRQQNIAELSREVESRAVVRNDDNVSDDNSTLRVIHGIIKEAHIDRASDIHLEQREDGLHVRYRIDGIIDNRETIPASNASSIITAIKTLARLRLEEKVAFQSGRIAYTRDDLDLNLRVETSRIAAGNEGGEKVVMRLLRKTSNLGSLESLLFSPTNLQRFVRTLEQPHGIVLFTGPTGSGKTTTIFTSLKRISVPQKNTLTIEDPVEITLPGISQHEVNDRRGVTMASALRSFLRQDPDIILVGEIRDADTAKVAIEAALTGHLVIASLHTNTATGAITRLREMGIEDFNISAAINGIMAQRLVPKLCSNCKQPYTPDEAERLELGLNPTEPVTLYRPNPNGCAQCLRRGYKDRIALHEFLSATPAVKNAITTHQSETVIAKIAMEEQEPMVPMSQDGNWKVAQGLTTRELVRTATKSETES